MRMVAVVSSLSDVIGMIMPHTSEDLPAARQGGCVPWCLLLLLRWIRDRDMVRDGVVYITYLTCVRRDRTICTHAMRSELARCNSRALAFIVIILIIM